jgi:hypothetical protein
MRRNGSEFLRNLQKIRGRKVSETGTFSSQGSRIAQSVKWKLELEQQSAVSFTVPPAFPLENTNARGLLISPMMEAAGTFETPINFCQNKEHNNPEDGHLYYFTHGYLKHNKHCLQNEF